MSGSKKTASTRSGSGKGALNTLAAHGSAENKLAPKKTTPAPKKITPAALRAWPLPDPSGSESKEDRGRVLVVGGSRQLAGAVLLAGIAALRAGAGKLQVATAQEVAVPIAIALPEAKVMGLRADGQGAINHVARDVLDAAQRADAVLVGPGMDPTAAARRIASALIEAASTSATPATLVLDAGALHLSAVRAFARRAGRGGMVLTPHLGEMAALLEVDRETIAAAPAETALAFARQWGVVLALKGATTYIATPDGGLWINTAGSVGLGTSGSGDVLAGLVAGLAARGAPPDQAAVWGVALHARAGARLSRQWGPVGFLAREISAEVPGLMRVR